MSDWEAKVLIRRPEGWPAKERPNKDEWEVWLDGANIARKIVADSLVVTFPSRDYVTYARVSLTLAAEVEVDVPDAILHAVKETKR